MSDLVVAASTGRVVASIVIGVLVIGAIITVTVRMYRSPKGPEPTMAPVTKKGKERMNRSYLKHGWPAPFDDEGNPIPRSERKLPDS